MLLPMDVESLEWVLVLRKGLSVGQGCLAPNALGCGWEEGGMLDVCVQPLTGVP